MIFFYLLPTKKSSMIPYLVVFAMTSYAVGVVMSNLGYFEYIGIYKYIAPLTFLLLYSISTWVFLKNQLYEEV